MSAGSGHGNAQERLDTTANLCRQEGRIISIDNLGKRTGGDMSRENRAL